MSRHTAWRFASNASFPPGKPQNGPGPQLYRSGLGLVPLSPKIRHRCPPAPESFVMMYWSAVSGTNFHTAWRFAINPGSPPGKPQNGPVPQLKREGYVLVPLSLKMRHCVPPLEEFLMMASKTRGDGGIWPKRGHFPRTIAASSKNVDRRILISLQQPELWTSGPP